MALELLVNKRYIFSRLTKPARKKNILLVRWANLDKNVLFTVLLGIRNDNIR